jgi:hypothetical protein
MTSHRHRRLRAGTLAALAALTLVACGDDDDATAPTGPAATAPETDAPLDTATPTTDAAPTTVSPATTAGAPVTTTDHSAHSGDDAPVIAVDAVDYSFQDLPATVAAGTTLSLTNNSAAELHEIVAFRLPDTETRSIAELMALPEAELEPAIAVGPPALVMLAPPGEQGFPVLGDGTLSQPGRYVVLCGIPIGADPQAYLDAAQTSDGPPDVPGGPPHFTAGMFAELIVEAA